jgi:hypothetical protein
MFVLYQGEPDIVISALSESDSRRYGHLGIPQ